MTVTSKSTSAKEAVEAAADSAAATERGGVIALLDSYKHRDPAARYRLEVALTSTGLHAVMWHHMCHFLWRLKFRLIARMVANVGRWLFGVEIHPQARIGRRLFIDHGAGIVIGGTSEIGNDVSLYQGVTLGGVTQKDSGKRHPTIGDYVVIGAGAKILGPVKIGERARVGSNAVVTKDVPAGTTVVGVPAYPVQKGASTTSKFVAYAGTDCCEDPTSIEQLSGEIKKLQKQLDNLSKKGKAQAD